DATHRYTNFGPLQHEFATATARLLSAQRPPATAAVSSGTAALSLALRALDLPRGSRALVPALTFPATASAAIAAGLAPVFAAVAGDSWWRTPPIAEKARGKIEVVVPVAAYGCALPVDAWDEFARRTAVPVVMDAAGAFLRQAMPQRCIVAFSFHATKTFGIGEGGLVAAHDAELVARGVRLSNLSFRAR